MSAITSPPAVSMVATSSQTRPRSCTGVKPRRVKAADTASVSPTRSARSRTATVPANGTTPDPSAVTDNPRDHEVGFTYEVPSRQEESNRKQVRFSLICKALSRLQPTCHSIGHERSGVATLNLRAG
jgi:hypothetical protein